jgi:hypothetical protein
MLITNSFECFLGIGIMEIKGLNLRIGTYFVQLLGVPNPMTQKLIITK